MTHVLHEQEISMLRTEIEMLMNERKRLLRVAGAAAVFVANLDTAKLPPEMYESAEMLSKCLNDISEDTLGEALEGVKAEPVENPR
ncbi:MAG TPA: hypothetical protein PLK99_04020 [Burkholderiales bacterium]|nr:hypothetical protein [Burkholderiales bacterium]